MYFRYVDQSDPAIQKKMKAAYEQLLSAEYISAELSPTTNWLTSFQEYAEQQGAANVDGEGAVVQAVFYDLLEDFLSVQVRRMVLRRCVARCMPFQANPEVRLKDSSML